MEHEERLSYGLEEAERLTGVSSHTFRRLVRLGKIRAARIGRRIVIPAGELQKITRPGSVLKTVK